MSSGPHAQTTAPGTHSPLRLRLKPNGPSTGFVDGAWWPRSRDLAAEVPALAEELAVRLGPAQRVAFGLSSWDTPPRRFLVGDSRVRLEGFLHQDQHIVHVTGDRGRISLLLVPPATEEHAARDALTAAGSRDNTDRPDEILAATGIPAQRTSETKPTEGNT